MRKNPCIKFQCTDSATCELAYSGACTGTGFTGHENCGCDYCEFNHVLGPNIICKKDIDYEDLYDWEEDFDIIANP